MDWLLFHLASGILILVNLPLLLEIHTLEPLVINDRVTFRSLDRCLEMTELRKTH
jgi:hypothetical protein